MHYEGASIDGDKSYSGVSAGLKLKFGSLVNINMAKAREVSAVNGDWGLPKGAWRRICQYAI